VAGESHQAGISFTTTYSKDSKVKGEGIEMDTGVEGMGDKHLTIGDRKKQVLKMDYFIGENVGNVVPLKYDFQGTLAKDTKEMEQRFDYMGDEARKQLRIHPEAPQIPADDFNGLTVFSTGEIGYGILVRSTKKGIGDKSVALEITEGLLADASVWEDVARSIPQYDSTYDIMNPLRLVIDPKKMSFKELLRSALNRVHNAKYKGYWTNRTGMQEIPAEEYITDLGRKYLPDEVARLTKDLNPNP